MVEALASDVGDDDSPIWRDCSDHKPYLNTGERFWRRCEDGVVSVAEEQRRTILLRSEDELAGEVERYRVTCVGIGEAGDEVPVNNDLRNAAYLVEEDDCVAVCPEVL